MGEPLSLALCHLIQKMEKPMWWWDCVCFAINYIYKFIFICLCWSWFFVMTWFFTHWWIIYSFQQWPCTKELHANLWNVSKNWGLWPVSQPIQGKSLLFCSDYCLHPQCLMFLDFILKEDYFITQDQIWVPLRWIAPEIIDEVHGNLLVVDQTKTSNIWWGKILFGNFLNHSTYSI